MKRVEGAERLLQIKDQMRELLDEAREIAEEFNGEGIMMANANAYVFEQIEEHLDNGNPYNQSLTSLSKDIEEYEN